MSATIEEKSKIASKVINIVHDVFGVKYSEIRSEEQRPEVTRARHALSILLSNHFGMICEDVAEIINRDVRYAKRAKEYITKMAVKFPMLEDRYLEAKRRVEELEKGGQS